MNDYPIVLAGPIVRRTEAKGISVWCATKEAMHTELNIYESAGGVVGPLLAHGVRKTIELAPRLHVVVITAQPDQGKADLSWGATVFYDLVFQGTDGVKRRLADLGVLGSEDNPQERLRYVTFPEQPLPSVQLPSAERTDFRLTQGSCRKPHGKGQEMLGQLHEQLAFAIEQGKKRPQQLFLTGDQVYADDVDDAFFDAMQQVIVNVAGTDAEMEQELSEHRAILTKGRRGDFVRELAGFSSTHAENHLVTLLEFYTMYLLTWSGVMWRDFSDEKKLRSFRAMLPNVRRVLANVATYMSFDDHEVTDDWNRSSDWLQKVSASDHGQRIIRNGLCAFAVFQQWGNAPADFEGDRAGARLLEELDGWKGLAGSKEEAIRREIFVPRSGETLDDLPKSALRWNFQLETPSVRIFGLDIRTRRELDPNSKRPGIICVAAIDEMLSPSDPNDPKIAIVVSPVAVLGIRFIEKLQKVAMALGLGDEFDVEPWGLHEETYNHLLERLAGYRRCVVLSGDIHFSFSSGLVGQTAPHEGARIVNYTSSALLNQSLGRPLAFVLEQGGDDRLESVGFAGTDNSEVYEDLERTGLVHTSTSTFYEEIFVERSESLESVDGSLRRVAAIGQSNYGDLYFDEEHVFHRHWWWDGKKRKAQITEHAATFPPFDA